MPTWSQGDLSLQNTILHYYRTGGDKPALVMLHGFSDDGLCWTQTARDLEVGYDGIMLDARGHGLSGRLVPGEPLDLAGDIVAVIQALGLEQPVLLGHSLGASMAALVAARHPQLVRGLVLEDPPWRQDMPAQPEKSDQPNPYHLWLQEIKKMSLAEAAESGRQHNPGWDDETLELWARSKQLMDLGFFALPFNYPDWQEVAAQIKCRTLVLTGDVARGAIITPEVAQQITRLIPQVEIAPVEGAGHCIRYEAYPAYIQKVKQFLHTWH